MGRGFDIPLVGRSKYHGYGVPYAIDRGVEIPWVGGSIYYG